MPRLERMANSRGLCQFEKHILITLIGFVIQPNMVGTHTHTHTYSNTHTHHAHTLIRTHAHMFADSWVLYSVIITDVIISLSL